MVKGDPAAIIRARWLASRTSSNRLSTLSMQSSTVTRAIAAPVLQGWLAIQLVLLHVYCPMEQALTLGSGLSVAGASAFF